MKRIEKGSKWGKAGISKKEKAVKGKCWVYLCPRKEEEQCKRNTMKQSVGNKGRNGCQKSRRQITGTRQRNRGRK